MVNDNIIVVMFSILGFLAITSGIMCVASSFMDGEDALKLTLTIVITAVVVIIFTQ